MAGRAAIPLVRELFTSIAAKLLPGHDVCDTVHIVEEDRISKALARIDAATARLEQAADRPPAPSAGSGDDPDLERRHAALRKETSIAIAAMDALLKDMSE